MSRKGVSVTLHPAGEPLPELSAGDVILTHSRNWVGWLIRFGQALRFRGDRRVYANWNHACLAVSPSVVVEALSHGVVLSPISKYEQTEFALVRTPLSAEDQEQMVQFAAAVVRERTKYGYFEIASLALSLLWPFKRKLRFLNIATIICSGLVAEIRVRGWDIFPEAPIFMEPAGLAEHYDARGLGAP